MEHAMKLLKEGGQSLTEIAHAVGCFDSSHFNFLLHFQRFWHILDMTKSVISSGLVARPRSIKGGEVPRHFFQILQR